VAARGPGRFRVHPRRARRTLRVPCAFVKSNPATSCYRRSDAMLRSVGTRMPPSRSGRDGSQIHVGDPESEMFPGANRAKHQGAGQLSGARRHTDEGNSPRGPDDPEAHSPDTSWSQSGGPANDRPRAHAPTRSVGARRHGHGRIRGADYAVGVTWPPRPGPGKQHRWNIDAAGTAWMLHPCRIRAGLARIWAERAGPTRS
jgi:hypothetical protein